MDKFFAAFFQENASFSNIRKNWAGFGVRLRAVISTSQAFCGKPQAPLAIFRLPRPISRARPNWPGNSDLLFLAFSFWFCLSPLSGFLFRLFPVSPFVGFWPSPPTLFAFRAPV
jgi:hypothetical protein